MSVEIRNSKSVDGYKAVVVDCEVIEKTALTGNNSQWCVWSAQKREGQDKPAKVPYGTGRKAISVNDADKWLTFDDAKRLYESGRFDGIGVRMDSLADVVGLDLDNCIDDDGHAVKGKEEIVKQFVQIGSYIELSPSGHGLRQFVQGVVPAGYKENSGGLEVYSPQSKRYLTMSGIVWPDWKRQQGGPYEVRECQKKLDVFMSKWATKKSQPKACNGFEPAGEVARTAAEVLALLKRYNQQGKVTKLLAGDTSDHSGDHSKADDHLCCQVAFFCRDPKVIDEVMRGSGLMREKWDEMRGGETYGARTIAKALAQQQRNFDIDQAEKKEQADKAKADKGKLKKKGAECLVVGIDDLLTSKNQLRTDAWALTELLVRDRRLIGVMHFDEFSGYAVCNRPLSEVMSDKAAPKSSGRIDDDSLRAFSRWYGREWCLSLKLDQVGQALIGFAEHVRINPVIARLNELAEQWDGKARLDDWLVTHCKAVTKTDDGRDIGDYIKAVGCRWVISAVARAFQPGCKADCMLVLEGKQGARKSSAVRVLTEAVGVEYFREGFHLGAGKDDFIALRGRLVIEWGELSGLGKKDRNELKVFLSQQTDSYRQSYGIHEKDWPRTAVFCGTTNDGGYLADPSGGRRFWPVTVGKIDLEQLRRDAPMLWAEAVVRYKAGGIWWFDDNAPRDQRLLAMAQHEQEKRIGSTYWSESAADLADKLVCGNLVYLAKSDELATAMPWDKFSRDQMIAWLSASADVNGVALDDDNENVIKISPAEWRTVTDGLRLAGWESTKSNGTMKWSLTSERLDDLCRLHGRDVGPKIPPMRRAKRQVADAMTTTAEAENQDGISQCETPENNGEGVGKN